MANMVYNTVTITGPEEDIARFKKTCLRTRKNKHDTVGEIERWHQGQHDELCIDFLTINPLSEDERSKNIDLDQATSFVEVFIDEPGRYECEFATRWSAPHGAFTTLAEMFPSLHFKMVGGDGMDFYYEAWADNGVLHFEKKPEAAAIKENGND